MKKKGLIKVTCIDCGHFITIRADKNKDKELREFGWEKKGDGWQCPHCYYAQKEAEGAIEK